MKHERVNAVVLLAGVVIAAFACRKDPGSDPKTPPNSPIPKIDPKTDKPEADPVTPTSAPLPVRDAG